MVDIAPTQSNISLIQCTIAILNHMVIVIWFYQRYIVIVSDYENIVIFGGVSHPLETSHRSWCTNLYMHEKSLNVVIIDR